MKKDANDRAWSELKKVGANFTLFNFYPTKKKGHDKTACFPSSVIFYCFSLLLLNGVMFNITAPLFKKCKDRGLV